VGTLHVVDLYIGIIALDAIASSVPPEKLTRLRAARKIILGLLLVTGLVLFLQRVRRTGWLPR